MSTTEIRYWATTSEDVTVDTRVCVCVCVCARVCVIESVVTHCIKESHKFNHQSKAPLTATLTHTHENIIVYVFIYLFLVHLTMQSVPQTIQHWQVGWSMKNYLKSMWMKMVAAASIWGQYDYVPRRMQQNVALSKTDYTDAPKVIYLQRCCLEFHPRT
jgi:hypothetical protein